MKYKIKTGTDLNNAISDLGYNQSSFNRILSSLYPNLTENDLSNALRQLQYNIGKKEKPQYLYTVICNLLAILQQNNIDISDPKNKKG